MHASIFWGGSQRLYRSWEPGCWKHGKILRFLHRPEPMAGRLYLPVTCQALSRCVEEASDVGWWWWWCWCWCWWWRGGGGGGGEFNPWFGLAVAFQSPLACSECPGSPSTFANAHILKNSHGQWSKRVATNHQNPSKWEGLGAQMRTASGSRRKIGRLAREFRLDDLANFLYDGLGWCR